MAKTKFVHKPSRLETDMRWIVIGAVLAKQNLLVVAEPGTGKSGMCKWMPHQIFGEEHQLVIECSPSQTRADIAGYSNPLYKLTPNAEEMGITEWVVEGTPLDPRYDVVVLEELTRDSTVGFDELVHRMHDETTGHRPVFVANANWLTVDQRTLPLFERIASIYHFVADGDDDVEAFLYSKDLSAREFDLPTRDEVMQVRQWLNEFMLLEGEELNQLSCFAAIKSAILEVKRLTIGTPLKTNKRRLKTWKAMLYATGCYFNGMQQDWETLPVGAYEVLKFAYPCQRKEEQDLWQSIVAGLYDPEGGVVAEMLENAYADFKETVKNANGNKDIIMRELGDKFQNFSAEMDSMYSASDPRVVEAKKLLNAMYRAAVQGKPLDSYGNK